MDSLGIEKFDYDPHSRVPDYARKVGSSLVNCNSSANNLETVRRAVIDEIENLNTSPRVLFSTSYPEAIDQFGRNIRMSVWAENGSSISARVRSGKCSVAIPVKMLPSQNGKCIQTYFDISAADKTQLTVFASKDGLSKTLTRKFRSYSTKPLLLKSKEIICKWESNTDIDYVEAINASILLGPMGIKR